MLAIVISARERKRHSIYGVKKIDHVHAAHDDVGIGDPHHVDHAKNQVQAERQQRQHAAKQDAVDDRFNEIEIHCATAPCTICG